MKRRILATELFGLGLIFIASTMYGIAQGSFQNLDFEGTSLLQTDPHGVVPVSEALPGWIVYVGTDQMDLMRFNEGTLGETSVDLLGINSTSALGYRGLDGFSVLLQGGVSGSAILFPTAATIKQTGTLPADARSIQFIAQADSAGVLVLSLNGVAINYFAVSSSPDYTLYRGDVSAFAGNSAELQFSVSRLPGTAQGNWNIDSIEFSTTVVPEPSMFGLLSLGALLLGWRALKKKLKL